MVAHLSSYRHELSAIGMTLVLLGASTMSASAETIAGTASVIDGDTIEIHGTRIRLHAVDAIESRQRCILPGGKTWNCGRDAAIALANKIARAPISCGVRDVDRYGRLVAVCRKGSEDLNGWLVANGRSVRHRPVGGSYTASSTLAPKLSFGPY